MDSKKVLVIICLIAFLGRAAVALTAPALSYSAYETVRQVAHIQDTGLPLIDDNLAWGGRTLTPLPIYPYILAFGTIFLPDELALRLIPQALAVLLHVAIFFLALELTRNEKISVLAAAASVFIPAYNAATLLTLNALALSLPLLITLITLFLKLRKSPERRNTLLFVFILLVLTDSLAVLLVPFLVIAIALAAIHGAKGDTSQREFGIFASLFILWFYILLHRKSLATVGLAALRDNAPQAAIAASYSEVTLAGLATAVGIIPFGLALYAAYKEGAAGHVGIQAVLALTIASGLATGFALFPLQAGIAILAAVATPLAAAGLEHMSRRSRAIRSKLLVRTGFTLMAVLFLLTSALPTMNTALDKTNAAANPAVINASRWLSESSLPEALVLAPPQWGFLISHVAQRPVYIDEHFLGREDAQERYEQATAALTGGLTQEFSMRERIEYVISEQPIKHPCLNTVYEEKNIYVAKVFC